MSYYDKIIINKREYTIFTGILSFYFLANYLYRYKIERRKTIMNKLLNTVKSKALSVKEKALNKAMPALLAVAGVLSTIVPGYALPGEGTSPETLITSIIGIVLTLARYIGIVLVVTGVFQLVMAYKDDNADSKTRGVQLAIVGVILIGLKTLLTTAGLI